MFKTLQNALKMKDIRRRSSYIHIFNAPGNPFWFTVTRLRALILIISLTFFNGSNGDAFNLFNAMHGWFF